MTGSVVSKSPGVHPVIGKTFNWGAREPERGEGGEEEEEGREEAALTVILEDFLPSGGV